MAKREPPPTVDPAPPDVTVIIPAWNAAGTIGRAVASVLEATSVAVECIVVDDASQDGTADAVAELAAADPRVRLLRAPVNDGVSAARNLALDVARGTWLAFLDADDRFLPGGLDALVRPTADPTVRAVIGQRVWSDGERQWISPFYDIPDIREPGRKSIATHPGLLYYAAPAGKLFRRSMTTDLRFFGRVLGDQPWIIRGLLRAGEDVEVIGDVVYEWSRPHPDHPVMTITELKRTSALRAAEAADVAVDAFRAVSDEVDAQDLDPAARSRIKLAYLDRLIRSDLSAPVRAAAERSDPGAATLFRSVSAFLGSVPAPYLAASRQLVDGIFRPPIPRWDRLPRDARETYWTMYRVAVRADPRLARHVTWIPLYGMAASLAAGNARPSRRRLLVADGLMTALSVGARLLARRRRDRRSAVPGLTRTD